MKGQDDVRLEDVVVGKADLFNNDEPFRREQLRFSIARLRTNPLDRPSAREVRVHCSRVAAKVSHSHWFTAATSTVGW